MNRLFGAIKWRYEVYFSEYIDLYGSISFFVKVSFSNWRLLNRCKVAYIYANKGNVGDYISYRGISGLIGLPGVQFFASSVWRKRLTKNLIKLKKRNPTCLLVIGGGGLLQPVFEDFWREVLSSELRFCIVGVGVNRLKEREVFDTVLLQRIIGTASYVSIRDEYTREQVFRTCNVTPVMTVCPSTIFLQKYLESDITNKEPAYLLNVIHPSDMRILGIQQEHFNSAIRTVSQKMGLVYKETSNMSSDYNSSIYSIKNAAIVISSRLHGCIMSYSLGVPFVALDCDKKIGSFISSHTSKTVVNPKLLLDTKILEQVIYDELQRRPVAEVSVQQLADLNSIRDDVLKLVNGGC